MRRIENRSPLWVYLFAAVFTYIKLISGMMALFVWFGISGFQV